MKIKVNNKSVEFPEFSKSGRDHPAREYKLRSLLDPNTRK